jgi:hypothetical protein
MMIKLDNSCKGKEVKGVDGVRNPPPPAPSKNISQPLKNLVTSVLTKEGREGVNWNCMLFAYFWTGKMGFRVLGITETKMGMRNLNTIVIKTVVVEHFRVK